MVELREVGPGRTECCHEPIPAAADNHLDRGSLSIDRRWRGMDTQWVGSLLRGALVIQALAHGTHIVWRRSNCFYTGATCVEDNSW